MWIPEELAYKGKEGPQGMLVFDVELVKIVK
jgi:FKBP-type peptidyl-prolyl cis-trans isomerase